jgi:hypothetical protein
MVIKEMKMNSLTLVRKGLCEITRIVIFENEVAIGEIHKNPDIDYLFCPYENIKIPVNDLKQIVAFMETLS